MKKAAVGVALFLAATSLFAESSPTRRYIVGTRHGSGARVPLQVDQERPAESLRHLDMVIVDLTDEEASTLRRNRQVRFVEPDREVRLLGDGASAAPVSQLRDRGAQSTPYGISMVQAPQLWPFATGKTIKVAVIDTGIERGHPDLAGAYRGGYDFVNKDDDPLDDNGHGTHVAGTIAAANDATGVVGVAPEVEIYALKVLGSSGSGTLSSVISALNWAIDNKMNVLNLSLGSNESSTSEEAAFKRVADAGIIAVAASGNDYDTMQVDGIAFPAGYPTVLSVGAIDKNSVVAEFSQRGADLKVVAPGVSVLSTYRVGQNEIATVEVNGKTVDTLPMNGSSKFNVTGSLVYCGLGKTMNEFPASVAGNIALIKRGDVTFAIKAQNAKKAGAKAVIIFNREAGNFAGTLIDVENPPPVDYVFLPTVSMSMEDGEALRAMGNQTAVMKFGIFDDYAELQGTSMASPHVAGVVALVWSISPTATPTAVRNAVIASARDLGTAGFDNVYGNGVVDAFAAARILAPEKIHVPRRRTVRR